MERRTVMDSKMEMKRKMMTKRRLAKAKRMTVTLTVERLRVIKLMMPT